MVMWSSASESAERCKASDSGVRCEHCEGTRSLLGGRLRGRRGVLVSKMKETMAVTRIGNHISLCEKMLKCNKQYRKLHPTMGPTVVEMLLPTWLWVSQYLNQPRLLLKMTSFLPFDGWSSSLANHWRSPMIALSQVGSLLRCCCSTLQVSEKY